METIWYKNYEGKWVKSMLPATKKNLEFVRKHYALNGQCEIFIHSPFINECEFFINYKPI